MAAPNIKSNMQPYITYVCPNIDISVNFPFIYALFINNYEKYELIPIPLKIDNSNKLGIIQSVVGNTTRAIDETIIDIQEKYYKITI